ncbi:MAG: SGNH/GDSL hydrolase family protein [Enhydrobacter sp.]|nr:SGNH/GDSL hydrolase family protein [Enhydrobacter sp.]
MKILKWTAYVVFLLALMIVADHLSAGYSAPFRVADNHYHHGLLPNLDVADVWGDRTTNLMTNSLAFKDRERRPVPLQSENYRILNIGDSMIEGLGVPAAETLSAVIEDLAAKSGRPIEVLNASVASYSPRLDFFKLRYLLEEVKLKVNEVIVYIDPSDVQDEVLYRDFVPVSRDSAEFTGVRLESYLARNSFLFQTFLRPKYWRSVHDLVGLLYPMSDFKAQADRYGPVKDAMAADEARLIASLEPILGYVNPSAWWEQPQAFPKGWQEERFGWFSDPKIMARWADTGLALARIYIRRIVRLCREHNVKLRMVIYPNGYLVNQVPSQRYEEIWTTIAKEEGVELINLFPSFRHESPDAARAKYYIPKDVHWNEAGHKVMGEGVFDALK